jgi:ATP-binding cassette subfamily B protein
VREADRILVLDHGRVVEQGRHEDLLLAGGQYAELYRIQFEGQDGDAGSPDEEPGATPDDEGRIW